MIYNRPMVSITVTEDKGFLITVIKKSEEKKFQEDSLKKNKRLAENVNYIPSALTEGVYIAKTIIEAMEIVKYHTEVMLNEKE
jgi:hypothetical protein